MEAKLEKQQRDLKAGQRLSLECVCVSRVRLYVWYVV